MKKKIYIAGGGGMLGEAFYRQFSNDFDVKVTDIDLNAPWIGFLDFRDLDRYRQDVCSFQPDYLFHLGAHTDLEYCEENPEDAFLTNTKAVEYAVHISNALDIPLLYISTAGIFDGSKEYYSEGDTPNPNGIYARSKYLGEKFILENKADHLICRAGWMMGGGPGKDKKFVGRILEQIRSGRNTLNVVNDKSGTPTYTLDFARNVRSLLAEGRRGLFNMACSGGASRTEIAREIVRLLGKETEIKVNEVSSDFFNKIYFAPRPSSERLVNAKLDQLNVNLMRDWKTCLAEYLSNYYFDQLQAAPLHMNDYPAVS